MKYVFVDMDGVIAEYGYPNGTYDGEFQKGNYLGKKPIQIVIDEIIRKYGGKDYIIMICSAAPNAKAVLEKNEWLDNYFKVPYENRIFITTTEDKVETVRYFIEDCRHGNVQLHCILIDDKGTILAKAKSLGIECYHPSQIITLKEQEDKIKEQAEKEIEVKESSKADDLDLPEY